MLRNRMLKQLNENEPILICGPTASGKSKLAMEIAQEINGIIINADALQVYSGWKVLTARPSSFEEKKVKHFLYGTVSMHKSYSVGSWLKEVTDILKNNNNPKIIVGGTGLYFTALLNGLADMPEIKPKIREKISNWSQKEGNEVLVDWLRVNDVKTFKEIDQNNPARVMRAVEILHQTGKGLFEWQNSETEATLKFSKHNSLLLNLEVGELNNRISSRFKVMIETGAIQEVRDNIEIWDDKLPAFKAIGAKEIFDYLNNKTTLEDSINNAIIRTRQYAKRQRTWFRSKMRNWTHFES